MPDQPMNPALGPCLDPETMAAYLDNRLDASARARVESHLAACEACYELVMESGATAEEAFGDVAALPDEDATDATVPLPAPPAPVVSFRPRRTRWLAVGGAALAAAAALFLIVRTPPAWVRGLWQSPAEQRMAALVDAVGEQRFIEGRLTGGFKYGPLRSPTRAPNVANENLSLIAAAGELQKAAEQDSSPGALQGWAAAELLMGHVDRAIQILESIPRERLSAAAASDLSAAYAARARNRSHADDWLKAIDAADSALARNPSLIEALYNRAIALDGSGRSVDATDAWRSYTRAEHDPEWTAEAQRRLQGNRPGS